MSACPACHADLLAANVGSGPDARCPFCGEPLASPEQPAPAGPPAARDPSAALTPPAGSTFELVESGPERLVVHIPPGGKSTGGIGCFALAWNGFMCVFTVPWMFAIFSDVGAPIVIIVPVLLLFWTVGLVFLYTWLKMKRMRTYVLIEPQRVVLQEDVFGRKTTRETGLATGSAAALVVSYSINDRPVHVITVRGSERTLKFGTQLSEEEKAWLVETINGFLTTDDAQDVPNFCSHCGAPLDELRAAGPVTTLVCPNCGGPIERVQTVLPLTVPDVHPEDIPDDSELRVEERDVDRLQFSLPLFPPHPTRSNVATGFALAGLFWIGVVGFVFARQLLQGADDWFDALVAGLTGLFLIPGCVFGIIAMTITRGRITVSVDHDWVQIRWHWGPFGYTKRIASVAIERVQISVGTKTGNRRKMTPAANSPALADKTPVATLHVGESVVPLTTCHSREVTRQVAGLVQTQLATLGFRLVA